MKRGEETYKEVGVGAGGGGGERWVVGGRVGERDRRRGLDEEWRGVEPMWRKGAKIED